MGKGFQPAALVWWLIIPPAIFVSALMAHYPSVIPFESLGPVGRLMQYFHQNLHALVVIAFWATIVAHLYEASLARKICRKLRIDAGATNLWTIQTFILGERRGEAPHHFSLSICLRLGYPSLKILKGYLRQQN